MKKLITCGAAVLAVFCACDKNIEPEPTPLAPPAEVWLSASSGTSLTFSWTEVEDAVRYALRLDRSDDGSNVSQTSVTGTSHTFSGLETGTEYVFKVRAVASDDKLSSSYSEEYKAVPGSSTPDPDPEPDDPDDDPDIPDGAYEQFRISPDEDAHGLALAFPGAEGGGMYTTGGRGGRVIHVTNLNDSGEGSLRAAINESGPRIVVFDVAGTIQLKSELRIRNGNLTIAGQTAPGDGICLRDNTVRLDADNVIIRFMRFRLGDQGPLSDGSDAFWGRYHENIVIDHCSMSWATDENASFYANRNFTMQWCMISEALRVSRHSKGAHGYGGIWGGRNASFHHNLMAHNDSRNARIDHPQIYSGDGGDYLETHRGNVDYRNNVIYNWGSNSTYGGEDGHFNIVGNYYKPGPASQNERNYYVDAYWYYEKDGKVYADAYPELYLSGNKHTCGIDENRFPGGVYWHDQGSPEPEHVILVAPLPILADDSETCYATTHDADMAFDRVLEYAGASLVRDIVDARIASEARDGTATYMDGTTAESRRKIDSGVVDASYSEGGMIDSQSVVGGWPDYSADTGNEANDKTDSDGDGMPDWFEERFGLDPDSASDASGMTLDRHGRYSNLEMYLHWLVRDVMASGTEGGSYAALD